jgi:Protein of unknown function (DUF3592)
VLKPILLMLAGIACASWGIIHTIDDKAFNERGKEAAVKPIEQYTEITKKKYGQPESTRYEVFLTFTTEDGQSVSVRKSISLQLLQDLVSGKKVTITYLPEDPEKNRFDHERKAIGTGMLWFSSALFLVGLIWFLIRSKSESAQLEQLRQRRPQHRSRK